MEIRNIGKSRFLYAFFLPVVSWQYRMVFRNIFVENRKNVQANQPVLVAANHPTAFLDPILLGMVTDGPVFNISRADYFAKPFNSFMLRGFQIAPIFRSSEGFSGRDRNDGTFDYIVNKLRDYVTFCIFVEGKTHHEKQVFPLKKGIARIAFSAFEDKNLENLQIVPVGFNYSDGLALRSEVKVITGTPIYVKDYWEEYQTSPNQAILRLMNAIREQMMRNIIHVADLADEPMVDRLLTILRNDHPKLSVPVIQYSAGTYYKEKELVNRINTMPADEKEALDERSRQYFNTLKKAGLDDETLVQPDQGSWKWLFLLVAGLLPAMFGGALSWPGRYIARVVVEARIKKKEFRTSVWMAVTAVLNMFVYLGTLVTGLFTGSAKMVALALVLPIVFWFYFYYTDRLRNWWSARKALSHPDRDRLLSLRQSVLGLKD